MTVAPGQIRVTLPPHLRRLAGAPHELRMEVPGSAAGGEITIGALLDAVEARYPVLEGTIRGHGHAVRRPLIRFFACGLDLSHDGPDAVLPPEVVTGEEALHVVGAIAGG